MDVRGWLDRARGLLGHLQLLPAGGAFAAVLVCCSLTPSLLPRPPLFQGIVSGVAAASGYGLGVFLAWCWRGLRGRPRRPWPAWARWLLVGGGSAAGLVSLVLGTRWQQEAHRLAGTEPTPVAFVLLTPPIAVLVAALLLALARGIRAATRRIVGILERRLEPSAARVLGVLLVGLVAWGLVSGGAGNAVLSSLDASFAVADLTTPSGVERPTTALRSGSEESLVEWDDLGREGRAFVGRGPTAEEIEDLTDRPALEPIRAYAGLSSEDDVDDRAALAARTSTARVVSTASTFSLSRRPAPDGSSRAPPAASSTSLEATRPLSPSSTPTSRLGFPPVDAARARDAGRVLFDAVYGHWSRLPFDERPELFVFGESLGSFGAEEAFSGEYDLANRTSGALFVGPPNFNPLYGSFVDDRDSGSPEIEPVYRDGRIVRFTTYAGRTPLDDREWLGSRVSTSNMRPIR